MSTSEMSLFEGAPNAGLPATRASVAAIAGGAAANSSADAFGGKQLLRLLRQGAWAFGVENTEPEPEARWAINPMSFAHGWAAWDSDSATLMGERMVAGNQPPIARGDLPEVGAPWVPQMACALQCIVGEDKGTECLYKGTSKGQTRAITQMANHVAARAASGTDYVVPVVMLGVESYVHKKYGKIFTPSLDVVGWMNLDGEFEDDTAAVSTAAAEPLPATGTPEPQADAPAPSRRRRTAG